jgi:hypothetical protein
VVFELGKVWKPVGFHCFRGESARGRKPWRERSAATIRIACLAEALAEADKAPSLSADFFIMFANSQGCFLFEKNRTIS